MPKEANNRVVSFPRPTTEGSEKRLSAIVDYLKDWQSSYFSEDSIGITSSILEHLIVILTVILEEPTESKAAGAVETFIDELLMPLQAALVACPLHALVSPQDFTALWDKTRELERLVSESDNERSRLKQSVDGMGEMLDRKDLDIRSLEERLNRTTAELESVRAELQSKPVFDLSQLGRITEHFERSVGTYIERSRTLETRWKTLMEMVRSATVGADDIVRHDTAVNNLATEIRTELASLRENRQQEKPQPTQTATDDIERFSAEIGHYETYLQQLKDAIEAADERRQEIEAALEEASMNLKFSDEPTAAQLKSKREYLEQSNNLLSTHIDNLLQMERNAKGSLQKLQQYVRARKLVTDGIQDIPASSTLPKIPEPPPQVLQDDTEEAPEPLINRHTTRTELAGKLAAEYNLATNQLVIVSLYELQPPNPKQPRRKLHRGIISILTRAINAGLLEDFGWKHPSHVLREWRQSGAMGAFLKWAGSYSGQQLFMRTDSPLPWNPADLFTADEIAKYRAEFSAATAENGKE